MELQFDPEKAVARLRRVDRQLARVIKQAGPFTHRPQKMQSPFQSLLRAIVSQQLSGKAAESIFRRVSELYPARSALKPEAVLKTPDQKLRAAGLSRAKVLAVKDLSAKVLEGAVPTLAKLKKMDDEEIVSRLIEVRGVGRWTVEMMLMFRLGRPDVLPATDFGVRKGFMLTYGTRNMPTPKALLEHGQLWRPFRSVASWYLWRAVDLSRQKTEVKV